MKTSLFLYCALSFAMAFANDKEKSSSVGFWEKEGVRKVFEYKAGKWHSSLLDVSTTDELKKAPAQYSSPSKWTLFFDGKTYGTLSTKAFSSYEFYKQNGLQSITSPEPSLAFRKDEDKFSSWDSGKLRPILASSSDKITDPDQWKPKNESKIPSSVSKDIIKRMKDRIAFCKNQECEDDLPSRKLKESELKVSAYYQDAKGNKLLAVGLNFSANTYPYCDIKDDRCADEGLFWYRSGTSGSAQFLTKASALIDTADLNQDGHSEILFWINEYNLNGYELVDGKTLGVIRSAWSYH